MTIEEALDNNVNEILFTLARDNLISDWEYRNIDRDAFKAIFKNIKGGPHEEKRLWKIRICGPLTYKIYYSDIRELTESEAVKWYENYFTTGLIKDSLLYKKEGEWVTYEIN